MGSRGRVAAERGSRRHGPGDGRCRRRPRLPRRRPRGLRGALSPSASPPSTPTSRSPWRA